MLTIYIYSRRPYICSYIASEVGYEVAVAVKPNPTLLGGGVLRLSSPPATITPGSPMDCPGTAPADCPEPGCYLSSYYKCIRASGGWPGNGELRYHAWR